MTKIAQIQDGVIVALFNDETDLLPDNSYFVNVENEPKVQIGWLYQDGIFKDK